MKKRKKQTGSAHKGTSTNDGKAPYLRQSFWENETNKFWRSDNYSQASREQLAAGAGVTI